MNSHYRCLVPAALLTIKSEHAQLWTSGGRWGWLPVSAYERETIWYSSRESPTACAGYDLGQSSTRHRNIRLTAYSATLISRARTPIANLRVGKDWRRCPSLTHAGDADAVIPFSGAGSLTQSMRICRRAFSSAPVAERNVSTQTTRGEMPECHDLQFLTALTTVVAVPPFLFSLETHCQSFRHLPKYGARALLRDQVRAQRGVALHQ